MLFSGQTFARHWQTTKRVIGDGFNHAVRIGQQLDHGMQVGKKLLGALAPMLDHYGGAQHMKPIMSGLRAYDQGKSDVMHGVNNVQTQLHRIRRQVPEIDL